MVKKNYIMKINRIVTPICNVLQIGGFLLIVLYKQSVYIPYLNIFIIIAGIAPIVNFFFLVNTKYKVMAFLAMLAGTGFIVIGCTNVLQ
jgi:hypothetical protein